MVAAAGVVAAGDSESSNSRCQETNLAYIPRDLPVKPKSEFDKACMNQLFDDAYDLAKAGHPWSKYPPDSNPARGGPDVIDREIHHG